MQSVYQDPSVVVLERADKWFPNENGILRGIKGTWIRTSSPDIAKILSPVPNHKCFALVCCPRCGTIFALSHEHHEIDAEGKVSFSKGYQKDIRCTRCDFARVLYLDRYWDKPLYCMVYRERDIVKFLYTHATNQKEARKAMGHRKYTVIAIAPAIGFFVETDVDPNNVHGTILSAN